jgi:hypothetical protein
MGFFLGQPARFEQVASILAGGLPCAIELHAVLCAELLSYKGLLVFAAAQVGSVGVYSHGCQCWSRWLAMVVCNWRPAWVVGGLVER